MLVTLDTLRYDSFAGTASRPGDMPRLRALADASRVFRRHYAATSTTQPTHASLLTGLHPWEHGVSRNGAILSDEAVTVAERLREAGFRTGAVVASFPLHRRFGFAQGFDLYADAFTEQPVLVWEGARVPGARFWSRGEVVTTRAFQLFERLGGDRQFAWLHYFDPHDPYGDDDGPAALTLGAILQQLAADPAGVEEKLERARAGYAADVRALDAELGRLVDGLGADPRFETHWIFVADHGESFGEGGSIGHGKRLSPEQIRVPLILHSPRVEPGVVDVPVGSVDVAATLLALAGLPDPSGRGRDLTGPLEPAPVYGMRRTFVRPQPEYRTDGSVLTAEGRRFYAVRGDRVWVGDASSLRAQDGGAVPPEEASRLRETFAGFERALEQVGVVDALDPETREALEALGYAP